MLLLAIVALEVPLSLSLRDRVDSEVRLQATSDADVLAATAASLIAPPRPRELAALARSAGQAARGRAIIVDHNGLVLADSALAAALRAPYASRPEIAVALHGQRFQQQRHSDTLAQDILATAVPIPGSGRPAGAVRITQSVAAVHQAVRSTILKLVLIGLVVLVPGLLVAWFLAVQLAAPLARLDATARRVAGGDLDARAPIHGSAEQRSLAHAFNAMTERLGRLLLAQQDFVADASHQLRTPLTGMRLQIEEARAATSPQDAARELEAATAEVDRMATIIDELLLLSRAAEVDRPGELLDLGDVARAAAARWSSTAAQRSVQLSVSGNGAAPVRCARSDLDRAVDALLENAVRYTAAASEVAITVGPGRLEVCDRGPGLAPGEEQAVFERFHRGRAGRLGPAGTGLGLPIARALARRWNADATLVNRNGGGAVAALIFPPVAADQPSPAPTDNGPRP